MTAPDGAVQVFQDMIPAAYGYPAVLVSCISDATIVYAQPRTELMARAKYRIWAVINNRSKLSLEPIMDRVQHLLQEGVGANVSGSVIFCSRLSAWSPPMFVDAAGKTFSRLGAVYEIWAQPA